MSGVGDCLAGKGVLVTGATGFLGGLLVEKILRSCPSVSTLYLIVRQKKGSPDVQERVKKMFSLPLFTGISEEARAKVVCLQGDVSHQGLGLDESDTRMLIENTQFVFHVAASINFKAPLDAAIRTNVGGTRTILQLAKEMPNIEAFVYMSTAYCNCTQRDVIAEKVYPSQWDPSEILDMVESQSPESIRASTSKIIGGHPNTYSFSKLMAENLIQNERGHVPVAIVRPSIVLGTMKSPIPGWVENVNAGAVAFIAGAGRGVFRTLPAQGDKVADLVPSDLLTSLLLAAAWSVARSPGLRIFHFTSGSDNPLTWSQYCGFTLSSLHAHPSSGLVFYPRAKCRSSMLRNKLFVYLAHYLPGVILDNFARLRGEKPILLDIQLKYTRGMLLSDYFAQNEWEFSTRNTESLNRSLSPTDKKEFDFDIAQVYWPKYLENCVLGIRQFYHKESPATLPTARKYLQTWWYIDKGFWIFLFLLFWLLVSSFLDSNLIAVFIAGFLTLVYIWL